MLTKLIKAIHKMYTRLWLRLHWKQLRDNAPDEYVKALDERTRE